MRTTVTSFIVFTLFSLNTFAENYTQFSLPEGAKARLGKGTIREIQYSPDGTRLAVASSIGIWLYDTTTLQVENSRNGEVALLTGHTGWVLSVAFSPDGNTLASGSHDNTVRLWDARTGTLRHTLTGHTESVLSVAFSPDGNTLASGSHDNIVRLWDAVTGEHKRTLTGHTDKVTSVSFSPDGNKIASGGWDETVRLWDARTGTLIRTLARKSVPSVQDAPTLGRRSHGAYYKDFVYSVAFSPDGNSIASGSRDGTVRLWDAGTGDLIHTLTGHTSEVHSISFSEAYSVAFSPDGNTLASGSADETVQLWDARTGKLIRTLTGHTEGISSVAFSPDGNTIATASADETVRLWDAHTGTLRHTLTGHTDWWSYSVTFSPDGNTLASRSSDGTILLWALTPLAPVNPR